MMILTDHLMLDVLRSTTTTSGELCVIMTLTTMTHKSPASCSDLGDFVFCSTLPFDTESKFAMQVKMITCI